MENGRKAIGLWWNGANGDESLTRKDNQEFIYHSEYHGDHSENWILVLENGKEIARHNTKYIASINWE